MNSNALSGENNQKANCYVIRSHKSLVYAYNSGKKTLNKLHCKGVENSFEYLTPFSYGQEIPDK